MKRVFCTGCAAVVVALFLVGHGDAATNGRTVDDRPPPGLTTKGRLLWNFEGLLSKNFGDRQPSLSDCRRPCDLDFSCAGICSPLSRFSPYWYVFRRHNSTGLHISSKNMRSADFGNYPKPVLLRGMAVACDKHEKRFLVEYADAASFTLGCLAPSHLSLGRRGDIIH
jgi:hypothetical protein